MPGLYSAGWFAPATRRDAIYRWAELVNLFLVLALLLALATLDGSLWYHRTLFGMGAGSLCYRAYALSRAIIKDARLHQ